MIRTSSTDGAWVAVRASLSLLDRRDRWKYALIVTFQLLSSALDLLGVLLIGVVVLNYGRATSSGTGAMTIMGMAIPMPSLDSVWVIILVVVLLGGKSVVSLVLAAMTNRFLINRQSVLSVEVVSAIGRTLGAGRGVEASDEMKFLILQGIPALILSTLAPFAIIVSDVVLVIAMSASLVVLSPIAGGLGIAMFGFAFIAQHQKLGDSARVAGEGLSRSYVKATTSLSDYLAIARELIVASASARYLKQTQGSLWDYATHQGKVQLLALVPRYTYETTMLVGVGVILLVSLLLDSPAVAAAYVAVFFAASSRLVPSLLRIQVSLLTMKVSQEPALKTVQLLKALGIDNIPHSLTTVKNHDSVLEGSPPNLEVRGVYYTYQGAKKPALIDVSAQASAGQITAIVGANGAGKSTLLDVMLGLRAPDAGQATIGSMRASDWITTHVGGCAYVSQKSSLVSGSLADNIAVARMQDVIDHDRVIESLESVGLGYLLDTLPNGIDTMLGSEGASLSGGQIQRIALARALYTRPLVIVLDEPTAAVDVPSRRELLGLIRGLNGRHTVLLVSHLHEEIAVADSVIFMDSGRVIAQGRSAEAGAFVPWLASDSGPSEG